MKLLWRGMRWIGALLLVAIAVVVVQGWTAFGHAATGKRLTRMQASPQYKDGRFDNPQPLHNDFWGMLVGMFHASDHVSPSAPVATVNMDPKRFSTAPDSGLRVTWLGHATMLIEIDGRRLLTDPVWSERTSPISWAGPRRYYQPLIAFDDLPTIDAVLISHDHYDHLDYATIVALNAREVMFVVPLGVGAHLASWGVPETRIVELDWWQRTQLAGVEIISTPARHASGRTLFDKDATLWTSYAILGRRQRLFFSGDTGLFPAMEEIGKRFGPFDLTMIEVGQYHSAWPDWHIGPEQAVEAHQMLRGRVMLPMHWGLFSLAYHTWTEPAERVLAAAKLADITIATPKPGESIEPTRRPANNIWWPNLPWQTARQAPIVSSGMPQAPATPPSIHR